MESSDFADGLSSGIRSEMPISLGAHLHISGSGIRKNRPQEKSRSALFVRRIDLRWFSLFKNFFGKIGCRPADVDNLVLEVVSQSVIVGESHDVLCRVDTDLTHPFGIHVQTASPLLHDLGVKFLTFFA